MRLPWDKLSEAEASYETALTKANGEPWQQAEAFNRLGRIEASQGETDQATKNYTKALELDPQLGAAYANLGYLKGQRRLYGDAIEQYKQALQIAPNDKITEALLRVAERQQAFATDKSRLLSMKRRVKELLAAFQKSKGKGADNAAWTSTPLTVLLLPLQRKGSLAVRAGEKEFIQYSVENTLQKSGRVTLVELELLDTLLKEFKMNAADLANPETAARVGRILGARMIGSGRFNRTGAAGQLTLELRETASGIDFTAEAVQSDNPLEDVVAQGTKNLLDQLRQTYPLQGQIDDITPQGVVLNIGKEYGVTPGLILEVLGNAAGQSGSQAIPVGRVRVAKVEAQQSQAAVLKQDQPFVPAWKVREVQ